VVVGRALPEDAAGIINGSPARERLLAALDLWLLGAPQQDRAALAGLLAAADPDPFRDALRAAVARSDLGAVEALARRDEALRQPAWFAAALGSIEGLPHDRMLAVLGTAARARPRAFAVLMTAGGNYPINDPRTAADRLGWFRAALAVRPKSCVALTNLGVALRDRGDLDGAVAELRAATALDPSYAVAHNNLGVALNAKKDRDGAIAEYRTAIALDPKSYLAHTNLGSALTAGGDLDGAAAEFHTAIALDPKRATPHYGLGSVLHTKGDLDGSIAEFRTAIALDPKSATAHHNLGSLLRLKGDLDGAIAAFRDSLAIDPKHLVTRKKLGEVLEAKRDLKGAITAYQEANRLAPDDAGLKKHIADLERWQALMPRLDAVAAGEAEPAGAAEAAEFSLLCRQPFLRRYAASARLYAKACAADPKYANEPSTSRRYGAARCAALAGCGEGTDAPAEAHNRAALRGQALAWLETNLKLLTRRLASGAPGGRKSVVDNLSAQLTEKDLAGVRPGAVRVGWSPTEAAAWDGYWSNVRALLARAKEGPPCSP
jgi:tetratricopeptide (TPR) repeat protein